MLLGAETLNTFVYHATRPTLSKLGGQDNVPGTLTDWVLEPGSAAPCPLLAGSPGLYLL